VTLKVTSGGIDKGSLPMCDGRLADAENCREETTGKAGRRKAGIEAVGIEAIALSSPRVRAPDNMVDVLLDLEALGAGRFSDFQVRRHVTSYSCVGEFACQDLSSFQRFP